jgi:hypothetical protein
MEKNLKKESAMPVMRAFGTKEEESKEKSVTEETRADYSESE